MFRLHVSSSSSVGEDIECSRLGATLTNPDTFPLMRNPLAIKPLKTHEINRRSTEAVKNSQDSSDA